MTGGDTCAQSGIDRLMLFVLAVLVVVFATPFVLGAAGIDVRAPPAGGTAGTASPPALVVLETSGTAVDVSDPSVGVVRMVVTTSGDQPLDLSDATISWSDGGGAYTLVHTSGAGQAADGQFSASLVRANRTGTTLSQWSDRGVLRFDLGSDNIGGIDEFGTRLQPGETVTVRLTTAAGQTTTTNLTVPGQISSGGTIPL